LEAGEAMNGAMAKGSAAVFDSNDVNKNVHIFSHI